MATERWFRWHHGTVTDPKWKTVASRASKALSRKVTVGHIVSVWAAMMENASQAEIRGELENWSDEDIANALDLTEEEVAAIRIAMIGKTLEGDRLSAWKRRQPKAEDATATERKRAQRERDRSHDATAAAIESRRVTEGHNRVEEIRGEEERKDSLRSSSSIAAQSTGEGDESDEGKKARKLAEAADRLATHTANAMASYNRRMAKPQGLLAVVTDVGVENRRREVKRCLTVARRICEHAYGSDAITPQFWDEYFALVDRDDFKSGRQQPGKGHAKWVPGFEYLTRPDVMTSVFETAQTELEADA